MQKAQSVKVVLQMSSSSVKSYIVLQAPAHMLRCLSRFLCFLLLLHGMNESHMLLCCFVTR